MRKMTVAHVRELVFEEIRHILKKRVEVQDYSFSVNSAIDHISYDTPKEYIGITDVEKNVGHWLSKKCLAC